ncbi:hypothetical protein AAFF_G00019670 [Aldrovandia affinis]|uniref:Uncharacterized protein n=1 Tax=Aldrovandia affinis TaxID=143900 RepID=A0AAD7WH40_9TELE|nr:hypothetical protein AAFF_G00019670 [Aldrovandia affinis]
MVTVPAGGSTAGQRQDGTECTTTLKHQRRTRRIKDPATPRCRRLPLSAWLRSEREPDWGEGRVGEKKEKEKEKKREKRKKKRAQGSAGFPLQRSPRPRFFRAFNSDGRRMNIYQILSKLKLTKWSQESTSAEEDVTASEQARALFCLRTYHRDAREVGCRLAVISHSCPQVPGPHPSSDRSALARHPAGFPGPIYIRLSRRLCNSNPTLIWSVCGPARVQGRDSEHGGCRLTPDL